MDKKCFAMGEKFRCRILAVKKCPGFSCSFYMTAAEQQESQRRAFAAIAKKDRLDQQNIADKYYGGHMPWLLGGGSCDC